MKEREKNYVAVATLFLFYVVTTYNETKKKVQSFRRFIVLD